MEDEMEDSCRLDELPYVCLWHICSYLSPENLCRISRVNKILHDVSNSEQLWRDHSFNRWEFCNINQVSEGPRRWQRYFKARRSVESHMDTGRPTIDYRVKSLRGHNRDIINAICLDQSSDNLENPMPPLVVSLSADYTVYAWDVIKAKTVWSVEGKSVSCIAGNNSDRVAVGENSGYVTVYSVSDWTETGKYPPPTHRQSTVRTMEFATVKGHSCLLVCYCLDDYSGEIHVMNLERNALMVTLTTSTECRITSVKGAWLAAAHENSASEVFVWNLDDLPMDDPPSSLSPHVTLHLSNNCTKPLIWLRPGTLATCSTELSNALFPPPMPGPVPVPPGQVHILQPGIRPFPMQPFLPNPTAAPSTELEVWDALKHMQDSKKLSSQVYHVKHMYDSKVVKLSCLPSAVAYSNGVLVVGESSGRVKVVDIESGKCLQEFTDHKASVTDIYADSRRVLTCSKDFSIRVYSWTKETVVAAADQTATRPSPAASQAGTGGTDATTTAAGAAATKSVRHCYKLTSRYQLLGGSVALKTHNGFNRVLCQSGSCIGVAGNIIKLYSFAHQLKPEKPPQQDMTS